MDHPFLLYSRSVVLFHGVIDTGFTRFFIRTYIDRQFFMYLYIIFGGSNIFIFGSIRIKR